MRILVAIVHFFGGTDPRHGSTDDRRRAARTRVVNEVVQAYRGLFGRPATLDIASRTFQREPGGGDHVDIAVVTVPGHCLLDQTACNAHGATVVEVRPEDPRMLGFHVHELFAQLRSEYDLFVFTEDDLRPTDPDLFAKIGWFNAGHGGARLLFPNRFEWNTNGPAIKTYIDGDLRPGFIDPVLKVVADCDTIEDQVLGRTRVFRRARNPHSGFFAVTQAQLGHWMRQPHWLDRDVSFVSPLESAATLGAVKTFAIYKPFGRSAAFLELQHMENRFSGLDLPMRSDGLGAALPA